jgi:hypothetical protein
MNQPINADPNDMLPDRIAQRIKTAAVVTPPISNDPSPPASANPNRRDKGRSDQGISPAAAATGTASTSANSRGFQN